MSKRDCNQATILARMTEMAGTQYQTAQLARYFGVNWMVVRACLDVLKDEGRIRKVKSGGSPTVWYVPSAQELAREQGGMKLVARREYVMDTVTLQRLRESELYRERYPSKG